MSTTFRDRVIAEKGLKYYNCFMRCVMFQPVEMRGYLVELMDRRSLPPAECLRSWMKFAVLRWDTERDCPKTLSKYFRRGERIGLRDFPMPEAHESVFDLEKWGEIVSQWPGRDGEILRLRNRGDLLREIGEKYGLSKERVRQILEQIYCIVRRDYGELFLQRD